MLSAYYRDISLHNQVLFKRTVVAIEKVMKPIMNVINFRMPTNLANSLRPSPVLLTLFFLFGFSQTAQAEEVPRYTVEMIIFEHYALKSWTEEHWPDEIELPSMEKSTALSTHGTSPLYIQNSQKTLDNVVKKMGKGYRVLFHQAWSQNAYKSKNAPKIIIENDRQGGSQMLGTVKLNKTRFAHVEVDLEFEKSIPNKIREAFAENQQLALEDLPSHWRFTLKESRKIKEGQLHYIDHPLFGVLVQLHKND